MSQTTGERGRNSIHKSLLTLENNKLGKGDIKKGYLLRLCFQAQLTILKKKKHKLIVLLLIKNLRGYPFIL